MMMFKAFPKKLYKDVLLLAPFNIINLMYNSDNKYFSFKLTNDNVKIPYRYNIFSIPKAIFSKLSINQKKIIYCIQTRSSDGYEREKYIKKILNEDIEEWQIPFIIKLCDDYLIEILEIIYDKLKDRNNTDIKNFCLNNQEEINKTYSRMVSYWNEYYRDIDFNDYVGNKIFVECLDYKK